MTIEANEYKDYILGFIFYKYLSDKEVKFLKENDYDDELLKTVSEEDDETVKWVQENIGYFIAYAELKPQNSGDPRKIDTIILRQSRNSPG